MGFLEIYDALRIIETELVKEYEETGYIGVFYSKDVKDIHVFRILKDYNSDYEVEEGKYLLEYDKISIYKLELNVKLAGVKTSLNRIAKTDLNGLENWDCEDFDSYEEVIERIKGGYTDNIIIKI